MSFLDFSEAYSFGEKMVKWHIHTATQIDHYMPKNKAYSLYLYMNVLG